jgi:hypothetical protein
MTATAPTTPDTPTEDDRNRTLYWVIGAVLVALAIIGVITFSAQESNAQAQQKAQQLTQKFRAAGLAVPASQETIIRQLGDDGGYVCHDPASALGRGLLYSQIVNGASFVGQRPVIAPRGVLQGELLILQTYCPDKVPSFSEKFDHLKTDDTVKG